MKRSVSILIAFFFSILISSPYYIYSQTKEQREKVITKTNVDGLKKINIKHQDIFKEKKEVALSLAKEKGWVIREERDGNLIELMKISKDGTPIYYTTYNKFAAIATRANTLHNGGLLGLNVEGQGMTAHVWDGGLARVTHNEYDGAGGTNRFSVGDGSTALHYHSAHVTGTIMASGVQPDAKGMAPQAYAVGFDWNNDLAEAAEAASNGMLLSNHSYGWRASDIPDWYFGAYLGDSRDWDEVMYNAPYYLMCVAAGNDGDDNSSNGLPLAGNSSYDKLSSHATSKNNLVVANASSISIDAFGNMTSVSINSSSSEGPTDDLRIKPDITGKGTNLYSTFETSNTAYGSLTGTSMASPNVTGTLLLLQQHYNNLNSNFMKAATLKGLALHTADDAGTPGPDAIYGWGLLNAKKAATVISSRNNGSIVSELSLIQGGSYTIDLYPTGTENLVVSISWTDPAGPANEGTANLATPALVNDLDVRVTKSTTTYFPYRLTSVTTSGTGDNTVDPFEKIIITSPTPGSIYTVRVSHKGTLSAKQDFSLIISGIQGNSPNSFTSVSNNPNEIDLSWGKNASNNDVLMAMSTDGVFGNPVNAATYNVNDEIPGGGTVLYKGGATEFNHTALTENTHYYYKLWSILPSGDYSAGVYTDEITIKSTPTNYPTLFSAGTPTGTTIPLTWADATGGVIPDGYLVKASLIGYSEIAAPINGVAEENARLVKNIAAGIQTVTFDSLIGVTRYYFKIFPYTNSGANIYYKTDGTAPQATAQTEIDPCANITLPYSENFDSGDNCWNGITGNGKWINVTPTTPAGDHTGGGTCFVTNGNNEYGSNSIFNLVSPKINLYGYANCQLTFWIYMNAELSSGSDYWDGGYIECFDGTVWKKMTTSLPYDGILSAGNPLGGQLGWSPSATRNWTLVTVDISEFDENPNFRIRFRFGSDGAASGAGWAIDDINVTGELTCTPPASQATNFVASNETYNSVTVDWTRGTPSGGDNVLVVARKVSTAHVDPIKGEAYVASAVFGEGDEVGVGNFVVYNGTGTSIEVTGLNNLTAYNFSVYEYSSSDYCYNLIELSGTATTEAKPEPTNHATNFATGSPNSSAIPLTWTDATGGIEPNGYLILANTTGIFIDPTNAVPVANDTNFGDGSGAINIEQGIGNYVFTDLSYSTHYYFKIYPYTNSGDLILYKVDGIVPATEATTLVDPCSMPISDLSDYIEPFTASQAPQCWEVTDNQGNEQVWQFGTISSITFGTGNYAFLNSDAYGSSNTQNSDLITKTFDLSTYTNVTVSFTHYYRHVSSSAKFYYSIDNGENWIQVQEWAVTTTNPTSFSQVISALDGQSQVKFKFNYIGTYGWYWCVDNFDVTGIVACTPPTNQATNFISTGQTQSSVSIEWTRGTPSGGEGVIVLAKEGAAVNSNPAGGVSYTASNVFGSGSVIGGNNYVVYSGTGTSATVTNLNGASTYHFAVYEYNTSPLCYKTPGLTGNATTSAKDEPTNHATFFAAGSPSGVSIPLTWSDASEGILPDGYIILVNTTGVFTNPTDTQPIADDLNIGDGFGAKNIAQGIQNYTFNGLNNSTQYFFKIYSYSNSGALIDYKTDGTVPETNATTLSDPCAVNLSIAPYTEGFEGVTVPSIPACTSIENTNGDGYQWATATSDPHLGTKHLTIRWNSSLAMNDWFFSPPLMLEAGYEYNLSFWFRAESGSYPEKLEVKLGTSNSSTAMTLGQLFVNEGFTSTTYAQAQATFTPSSDGIYYIGWHGYSVANMWSIHVDDISVARGAIVNVAPVVSNPIADITQTQGFATYNVDLSTVFYDANDDALTYSAVSNNEAVVTVGVDGSTLTLTEVGIGASNITVTANDGNLTANDIFIFNNIVSTTNLLESMQVSVYPNPAESIINVEFKNAFGDVSLELIDVYGRKVYTKKLQANSEKIAHQINIAHYSKGIYFIKIYSKQYVMVKEVIFK